MHRNSNRQEPITLQLTIQSITLPVHEFTIISQFALFILSILDETMHFHVFRYLSKPLDKKRFLRNFQDALAYYNTMTQKIPIETHDGIYTVPYSHIIAIEAQVRKVIIHTIKIFRI